MSTRQKILGFIGILGALVLGEIVCGEDIRLERTSPPIEEKSVLKSKPGDFAPGVVIVKLKEGVGISSIDGLNRNLGVKGLKPLFKFKKKAKEDKFGLSRVYKIIFSNDADIKKAVERYKTNPEVEYAEPDYKLQTCVIPNDTSFSNQWGFYQTNDCDIDAPETWDIEKGSTTIVVAISDTGVDYNHQDLAANIWTNPGETPGDGIDNDSNGYVDDYYGWDFVYDDNNPMDVHGHGSHVAGIAGAVTNNGLGVAGTAWYCKIMAVKCFNDNGFGWHSDCSQSIIYAADNGAKVINMSWGGSSPSSLWEDALKYAWDEGVVLCAAAGNDNSSSLHYPAGYSTENGYGSCSVIAVGASNKNDARAFFSSYGPWVTVYAPGEHILSTIPGDEYATWNGTSMATPFVSGVCGLLFSHFGTISNLYVRERIKIRADYVGLPNDKGRLNAYNVLGTKTLPLLIITTSLPGGCVNSPYTQNLIAVGGKEPYIWSYTGSLPDGLTLSSDGLISGTPTTAGRFIFTAQVSDQTESSTFKELSIYVELREVIVYNSLGEIIGTYTTIQAGVNACPVDGTVSVSAGTYNEAVYINKRIALIGVGTPTITAQGFSEINTVTFDGITTNNALISGFMITSASENWTNGNGISCNNTSPTITNNIISGNNNGIVCNPSSSPTITNNTISGNNWRGIFCSSSSPVITNNTISGNNWGGIFCSSSSPVITNNTISGNSNGIICDFSSSPAITNNTISGNGNGINCWDSFPKIHNNIIIENGTTSTNFYGIYVQSGNPTIDYNNVWGNGLSGNNNYYNCSAGLHDISFAPQFIGNGNFHLSSISLCIDAGSNTASGIYGISTDKDGNMRIVNGTIDMGAYEYQDTPSFTGSISGIITDTSGNPISGALVKVISQKLTESLLTRGEARTEADGTFVITNLPFGTYTLRASSSNYHHSYKEVVVDSSISGIMIEILSISTTVLYVAATNRSGTENGSPNSPYSTIQRGVDATINGDTINVGSGTYIESIFINKQIKIIGAGYDTTTIDGGVNFSGNFGSNYSLEGFKITGAGNGILCDNSNPAITNNIISGYSSGHGIYCFNSSSPIITNNIISGNGYGIICSSRSYSSPIITNNTISGNNWGGICCYWYSSPIITNNTISGNSNYGIYCYLYSSSSKITNNTISGNSGYGIYCYSFSSPKIYNNIITENGTTNPDYYGIYVQSGNPTINYNNVWGNGLSGNNNYYNCTYGPNDISSGPQFISPSDFHLQPTSPSIDKGYNFVEVPSTDKDGKLRIIDGDNDGTATIDMGAYEFQSHGLAVEISLALSTNTITADGIITCTVYGADSDDVSWDATSEAIFSTTDPRGSWIATNIYNPGKIGTWIITAKIQGQSRTLTQTAIVTITHGLPVSLIISPADITLSADQSQCYKGIATDSDSNLWDATGEITWTEDDPDGTISSSGIYYAGRVGTWTITGRTTNGKVGTISVIVISGGITLSFAPTNNNAFAYPNPWKKNDLKQGGEYILFDRVSSGATIRIYNIVGELINKIDVTECPQKWDILNKNIASGVYIYVITGGGGGKKVGKIGIVK